MKHRLSNKWRVRLHRMRHLWDEALYIALVIIGAAILLSVHAHEYLIIGYLAAAFLLFVYKKLLKR